MGKNAQRDRKREMAMGLHKVGLDKRDMDAMNDVAHAKFGVGIGVIVQEEDRARVTIAGLNASPPRWWQWARWLDHRAALRGARRELALWSGRMAIVTEEVARLAPKDRVARGAHRR